MKQLLVPALIFLALVALVTYATTSFQESYINRYHDQTCAPDCATVYLDEGLVCICDRTAVLTPWVLTKDFPHPHRRER